MSDLVRVYKECIAASRNVTEDIYRRMADMPAKRFWVSPIRAAVVVSLLLRNGDDAVGGMHPLRREMFMELYRRVLQCHDEHPKLPLRKLCSMVVRQPAPKFYLSPKTIKVMLCKHKRLLKESGLLFL